MNTFSTLFLRVLFCVMDFLFFSGFIFYLVALFAFSDKVKKCVLLLIFSYTLLLFARAKAKIFACFEEKY